MEKFEVLYDTSKYEVPAEFDNNHSLTPECTQQMIGSIKENGFVIVPNLLSNKECDETLKIVKSVVDDPNREIANFASETDISYRRRDFCPLPSNENILQFCSQIVKRVGSVLTTYSDRDQMLLEISTLTSYQGSSHQYIHRDPPGVLSVFAALDDVSIEQGGTVFVPGTQPEGALERHGKNNMRLMEVFNRNRPAITY